MWSSTKEIITRDIKNEQLSYSKLWLDPFWPIHGIPRSLSNSHIIKFYFIALTDVQYFSSVLLSRNSQPSLKFWYQTFLELNYTEKVFSIIQIVSSQAWELFADLISYFKLNNNTVHKFTQWCLTTDRKTLEESICLYSKLPSDILPNYIKLYNKLRFKISE